MLHATSSYTFLVTEWAVIGFVILISGFMFLRMYFLTESLTPNDEHTFVMPSCASLITVIVALPSCFLVTDKPITIMWILFLVGSVVAFVYLTMRYLKMLQVLKKRW